MQIALVGCNTPEQAAEKIAQCTEHTGIPALRVTKFEQVGSRMLATLSRITPEQLDALESHVKFVVIVQDKPS